MARTHEVRTRIREEHIAEGVVTSRCRCGCEQVNIFLVDERGDAFACAPFSPEEAMNFAAQIIDAATDGRKN